MGPVRRKTLSLVLAVALVSALLPVSTLSAGPASTATPENGTPAPLEVTTDADRADIKIDVDDVAESGGAFDVFRSTKKGTRGAKVSDDPVEGRVFVDDTAEPGVQYYYTIVVHTSGDTAVLEQVKAEVIEAEEVKTEEAPEDQTPVMRARQVDSAPRLAKAGTAHSLVSAKTDVASGTVIAVNTTWTKANSPYYIQGDVTVNPGVMLTIQPGVEVYFADFDDGGVYMTDWGFATNPTSKCDLIVRGRLAAVGTLGDPIQLSSVRESLIATPGTSPTTGDWGVIFTDSMMASQMTWCQVRYGEGIWAQGTSRPYIDRCDIVNNHSGSLPMPTAQVHFESPMTDATTPRIRVTNTVIGGAQRGIEVSWNDPTVDKTIDPFIAGNEIQGEWGIYLHVQQSNAASATKSTVRGLIQGNTIHVGSQDTGGVQLRAQSQTTAAAMVKTVLRDNTILSDQDYCIRAEAQAVGRGDAECTPMLQGGYHSTDDNDALYCMARSDEDDMANTGHAYASPVVDGGTYISAEDDCFDFEAWADGSGQARGDAWIKNVRMENADDNGVEDNAYSEYGNASASPVVEDSVFDSRDADCAIDSYASCTRAGTAVSSPIWRRGSIDAGAGEDGMETYAVSQEGRAVSNPAIYNTLDVFVEDHLIEADARGSESSPTASGGAECSPIVKDVAAIFRDEEGIDARANDNGMGDTVCSPQVWRSWFRCSDDTGIDYYAYSEMGNATANPFVTDSYLECEYGGVRGDAYINQLGGGTVKAQCSPTIERTEIRADDDDRIECDANNNGMGDAEANPVVTDSILWGGDDDYDQAVSVWTSVSNTGTAESAPVVTDTWIKSHYDAIDVDANANGAASYAKASGTYTDCEIVSTYDDAAEFYLNCNGNSAGSLGGEIRPVFTRCSLESWEPYDNALRSYMSGYGNGAATLTNSPVIDRCDLSDNVNGRGVYVTTDCDNSAASTDTVVSEPQVLYTPIVARNYEGIQVRANHDHAGSIKHNAKVLRSSVISDEGIEFDADASDGASVEFSSRVLGRTGFGTPVEASDEDGVNMSATSNTGTIDFKPELKNLDISANNDAVDLDAYASGAGDVTADPLVQRIRTTRKWAMTGDGVNIWAQSDGGGVSGMPTVRNSKLWGPGDDGVYIGFSGSTGATPTPVVANNDIAFCSGGGGIELDNSGVAASPASFATVSFNKVTKTYMSSIDISGIPNGFLGMNKTSYPGYGQSSSIYDSSGIYWTGAMGGEIKGNLIRAGRYGVSLESCNPYPTVNENSFTDWYGRKNKWNLWTDCPTIGAVNAQKNWWGYAASADISRTIDEDSGVDGAVDYSMQYTKRQPQLAMLRAVPRRGRIYFTLKFDRPMDTSIRRLRFGPSYPYGTFGVTGTWAHSTMWQGVHTRASLAPRGVRLYFTGARDLPGNLMNQRSKYFVLP